jgi:hypothetical protein
MRDNGRISKVANNLSKMQKSVQILLAGNSIFMHGWLERSLKKTLPRGKEKSRKTLYFTAFGVPGATRTRGLSLRRRTLYPTELQEHIHQYSVIYSVP